MIIRIFLGKVLRYNFVVLVPTCHFHEHRAILFLLIKIESHYSTRYFFGIC